MKKLINNNKKLILLGFVAIFGVIFLTFFILNIFFTKKNEKEIIEKQNSYKNACVLNTIFFNKVNLDILKENKNIEWNFKNEITKKMKKYYPVF